MVSICHVKNVGTVEFGAFVINLVYPSFVGVRHKFQVSRHAIIFPNIILFADVITIAKFPNLTNADECLSFVIYNETLQVNDLLWDKPSLNNSIFTSAIMSFSYLPHIYEYDANWTSY